MTELPSAEVILAASRVEEVVRLLRPHARRVIEAAEPPLLDAFDAAYADATADAIEDIMSGPATIDDLAGEQALGLEAEIANDVLSFIINVAAAIAVARCETRHPSIWKPLVGARPAEPAPVGSGDPISRLVARSGLPPADQARITECMRADADLVKVLASVRLP